MNLWRFFLSNSKIRLISQTKLILATLLIAQAPTNCLAIREARPTIIDSRIRVIVYNPDDVFKFTGYYGYQASVELSLDEEIVSISMGDSTAWQIVPSGNRFFIKPIEDNATTNMTMITNKRTYFFELYAQEATDIRDPDMVFNVRFLYPDEEDQNSIRSFTASLEEVDLSHPEQYNFQYAISGHEEIAPIKIFDDGEFTYLQFRDKNAEIPSILAVDGYGRESMVNFHLSKNNTNLVIVEQVFPKITLRLNQRLVCIFNGAYEDLNKEVKNDRARSGKSFWDLFKSGK
ncbi:MAG: P-type conjugative transfer protein VirB9 [Alphaproteobacteria bacterium]|nr:P-type conjugative transfer protein VirB9 [Alphaproteobacteria bacterium]